MGSCYSKCDCGKDCSVSDDFCNWHLCYDCKIKHFSTSSEKILALDLIKYQNLRIFELILTGKSFFDLYQEKIFSNFTEQQFKKTLEELFIYFTLSKNTFDKTFYSFLGLTEKEYNYFLIGNKPLKEILQAKIKA